jgi:hypothetical protein
MSLSPAPCTAPALSRLVAAPGQTADGGSAAHLPTCPPVDLPACEVTRSSVPFFSSLACIGSDWQLLQTDHAEPGTAATPDGHPSRQSLRIHSNCRAALLFRLGGCRVGSSSERLVWAQADHGWDMVSALASRSVYAALGFWADGMQRRREFARRKSCCTRSPGDKPTGGQK